MNANFFIPTGDRATRFVQWWARVQEQGKTSYITRRAILFAPGFIVFFVGLQVVYDTIVRSVSLDEALSRWSDFSIPAVVVWLLALSVGGILTGWFEWRRHQWVYRVLLNQQQSR